MKKLLVFLLLCALLCGCGAPGETAPPEESPPPETVSPEALRFPDIPEDYWEVFDTRCNMVFSLKFIQMPSVNLSLVSARPLTDEDVTVEVDAPWKIVSYVETVTPEDESYPISEDIFLLYQGITPQEIKQYGGKGGKTHGRSHPAGTAIPADGRWEKTEAILVPAVFARTAAGG